MKVELTEQEARALWQYISEHWKGFTSVASNYLTQEEIDDLGKKMEKL